MELKPGNYRLAFWVRIDNFDEIRTIHPPTQVSPLQRKKKKKDLPFAIVKHIAVESKWFFPFFCVDYLGFTQDFEEKVVFTEITLEHLKKNEHEEKEGSVYVLGVAVFA